MRSSNYSIDDNSENDESSIRRNDDGDIHNLRERLVSVMSSQDLSERSRGPSVTRTSAPALLLINADYDQASMRPHGDTITQSGESTSESMSIYPESMPLLLHQNRRHNHNYTENEDRRLITRDQLVPPPMTPAKRAKMELSPAYSWFSLLENYSAYTIQNNSKDNKQQQEQNPDDNQTSIILISNLHIQSAFTATSSTLPYCPQVLPIIFTLLYRGLWLALSLYILIADYRIERVFHVDYYNPNHEHIFSKSFHWFLSLFDNDNHHHSHYGGGGGHYHVHIEWNNVRRYYSHLTDCTTTLTVIYQICTCLLTIISAVRLTLSSIHNLCTTTCCTSRRKIDEEGNNEDENSALKRDEEEHDQYSRYQPNPFNVSSFIDSIEESASLSSQYPKNDNSHHHNAKKEKIKQLTQTNEQLSMESNQTGESKPGTLICLTWLLYSIVLPAEFIVSFGYWTFQRKHEDHALDFSDVYHHAIIAILLFIDGNIVGRIPLRLKHAIWLITYEFIYIGWNLAYSLLDLGHDGGVVYDVLNWRRSPKIAISVSLFMMFVIGPFIFMFCWFFSIWSFNCSFDGGRRFLVHYQYTKMTSCRDYVSADKDGIEEDKEGRRRDGWDRV